MDGDGGGNGDEVRMMSMMRKGLEMMVMEMGMRRMIRMEMGMEMGMGMMRMIRKGMGMVMEIWDLG